MGTLKKQAYTIPLPAGAKVKGDTIAVHAKEQTQFAKRSTKAIESIAKQERDKNGYEIIG